MLILLQYKCLFYLLLFSYFVALAVDPTVSITEPVDYSGKKIVTALKNSDVALVCVVTNKVADNQVRTSDI